MAGRPKGTTNTPKIDEAGNPVVTVRKPRVPKPEPVTISPNISKLHGRSKTRFASVVATLREFDGTGGMVTNLLESLTLMLQTTSAETFPDVLEFLENLSEE